MNKVDQTTFYDPSVPESGNCTQAAVASILGLTLDQVPDFKKAAGENSYIFWTLFEEFLEEQGFWTIRKDTDRFVPEGYYLASGPSSRGTGHTVVMKNGELAHDPHFSREGVLRIEHIWILVPFDPSEHPKSR